MSAAAASAGAPGRPGARRGVSVPVAWRTNRARLGAGSLGRAPSGSAAPCPWGRAGPAPGRGLPGLAGDARASVVPGAPSRHPSGAPPARRTAAGGSWSVLLPLAALVSVPWRCLCCRPCRPWLSRPLPRPRAWSSRRPRLWCRWLGASPLRLRPGLRGSGGRWWARGYGVRCPGGPASVLLCPPGALCGRAAPRVVGRLGLVVVGGRSARGPAVGGLSWPPAAGVVGAAAAAPGGRCPPWPLIQRAAWGKPPRASKRCAPGRRPGAGRHNLP